ncbi:MAG: hypothetical protein KBT18_01365 [Comamonas sp.]|nr:hypothetical protein [Candidatus Comamonas equi]
MNSLWDLLYALGAEKQCHQLCGFWCFEGIFEFQVAVFAGFFASFSATLGMIWCD